MNQPVESPKRSRTGATVFLVLYVVFLAACAVVTLALPPWKSGLGLAGFLGALATLAAGLPWSLLVLMLGACETCRALGLPVDTLFIVLPWLGALFNLVWLAHAAGWTGLPPAPQPRPSPDSPVRVTGPRADPRAAAAIGPRMPLRVTLERRLARDAERFDAARSRRGVTVPAVALTFLVGLPAAMGLIASAGEGLAIASGLAWSLGVLLALAGTWCRLLSSNAQLRQSPLRFGLAAAGTAGGLALAVVTAIGWALHAPAWAILALVLVAWQGRLLLATLGSRRAAVAAPAA